MGCRLSVLNFTWPWQLDAIFTVWNIMQWGVAIRMAVALFDQSPVQRSAVSGALWVLYWVGDAQLVWELEWQIDGSYGVHVYECDTHNLNKCRCFCSVALFNSHLQHKTANSLIVILFFSSYIQTHMMHRWFESCGSCLNHSGGSIPGS